MWQGRYVVFLLACVSGKSPLARVRFPAEPHPALTTSKTYYHYLVREKWDTVHVCIYIMKIALKTITKGEIKHSIVI